MSRKSYVVSRNDDENLGAPTQSQILEFERIVAGNLIQQLSNVTPLAPAPASEVVEAAELFNHWVNPGSWQDKEPPSRQWMVQGCFTAGNVSLVSGDGGIGKTILLLQLCAAAATGKRWCDIGCLPGRSIFLATEDDHNELWRRMYDIARGLNVELADIGENMLLRTTVGQSAHLIEFEYGKPQTTNLWTQLLTKARKFGASYVIIDTAAQTFGGNLTNGNQVVAYINQLRRLAIAIQGAVIVTQHPSLLGRNDGSGRAGTTQWENQVRSRLYFRKNKAGIRELAGIKSNYSLPLEPVPMRYDRGIFVPLQPDIPKWQTE